jgi:hypothetical protein
VLTPDSHRNQNKTLVSAEHNGPVFHGNVSARFRIRELPSSDLRVSHHQIGNGIELAHWLERRVTGSSLLNPSLVVCLQDRHASEHSKFRILVE